VKCIRFINYCVIAPPAQIFNFAFNKGPVTLFINLKNVYMKKFKILIAEDDALLLKALGFYLDKQGYDLSLVVDGRDAIDRIRKNSYDLIITDINMPFSNGMEIISVVRNELKLKTPIMVLTSMGLENTEIEAFQIGADEFVSKPFSPQDLGVKIEEILSGVSKNVPQVS
jgi:DNA-binding response OmpR family regulator